MVRKTGMSNHRMNARLAQEVLNSQRLDRTAALGEARSPIALLRDRSRDLSQIFRPQAVPQHFSALALWQFRNKNNPLRPFWNGQFRGAITQNRGFISLGSGTPHRKSD